jgi:hypothetical protein
LAAARPLERPHHYNQNGGLTRIRSPDGVQANARRKLLHSDRRFIRATLFGEFRATDVFGEGILSKMIGRHRFTGSYSKERLRYENRTWQLYASSMDWASFWTRDTSLGNSYNAITERPPAALIYLGPSLYGASSASGANISRIKEDITLSGGNIYLFDSTWTGGTNYADPWTIPANLVHVYSENFGDSSTQASNPANYIGWTNKNTVNPLTWDSSSDDLLASAVKTLRQTESMAGTWQGYMINDAVIGTFGWRYDKVSTKYASASRNNANRKMLDMENYIMPKNTRYESSPSTALLGAMSRILTTIPPRLHPIDVLLSSTVEQLQITRGARTSMATRLQSAGIPRSTAYCTRPRTASTPSSPRVRDQYDRVTVSLTARRASNR